MAAGVGKALNRIALLSTGVGLAGYALDQCLFNVDGGQRAVIWDRFQGIKDKVVSEGTHVRIPFIEYPEIFDVRIRPRVITSQTGTKDLQTVTIQLRILSRPQPELLPHIFRTLGKDFDERVLPSIGNEVLKATVAQYDADQLLTQREKVSKQIREALEERASEFKLKLDDVSITHLAFGKEFTKAIEAKQVAQQEAERSKFLVQRAEQEKLAAIIYAEGEAEAATLISQAVKSAGSGMIEVKRIDASREIAETLARSSRVTYLPGGNSNVLMSVGRGAAPQ